MKNTKWNQQSIYVRGIYSNISYIGKGINDANTVLMANILRKILIKLKTFRLCMLVLFMEENAKCQKPYEKDRIKKIQTTEY